MREQTFVTRTFYLAKFYKRDFHKFSLQIENDR